MKFPSHSICLPLPEVLSICAQTASKHSVFCQLVSACVTIFKHVTKEIRKLIFWISFHCLLFIAVVSSFPFTAKTGEKLVQNIPWEVNERVLK